MIPILQPVRRKSKKCALLRWRPLQAAVALWRFIIYLKLNVKIIDQPVVGIAMEKTGHLLKAVQK
jgi:hypothetical protein